MVIIHIRIVRRNDGHNYNSSSRLLSKNHAGPPARPLWGGENVPHSGGWRDQHFRLRSNSQNGPRTGDHQQQLVDRE